MGGGGEVGWEELGTGLGAACAALRHDLPPYEAERTDLLLQFLLSSIKPLNLFLLFLLVMFPGKYPAMERTVALHPFAADLIVNEREAVTELADKLLPRHGIQYAGIAFSSYQHLMLGKLLCDLLILWLRHPEYLHGVFACEPLLVTEIACDFIDRQAVVGVLVASPGTRDAARELADASSVNERGYDAEAGNRLCRGGEHPDCELRDGYDGNGEEYCNEAEEAGIDVSKGCLVEPAEEPRVENTPEGKA